MIDPEHDALLLDGTSGDYLLLDGTSGDALLLEPAPAAMYSELILARSPLAYWRLAELSGASSVVDSSGNGNHGTPHGTPIWEQAGALTGDSNTAVLLPTSSEYIQANSATWATNLLPLCFDFWFYYPATGSGGRGILVSKSDVYVTIASLTGFANENLVFNVPFTTTVAHALSANIASLLTVGWHYCVCLIDTDRVPRIFLDATEVSYNTQTAGVGSRTEADTSNPIRIGRDRFSAAHPPNLRVDEFAVFASVPTTLQIADQYDVAINGPPASGSSLRLTGGSLGHLVDLAGGGFRLSSPHLRQGIKI